MKRPHVPHEEHLPEFTTKAVFLGVILAAVMTLAGAYAGLYSGMTVPASIPAAVISMALLRGVFRRGTVLESNIVQTIVGGGVSMAAGAVITVPALVMAGAWDGFEFWPTVTIILAGGIMGVLASIPLRSALVADEKTLTFPEGVACAEVIKAGEGGPGFLTVVQGFIIGGIFRYFVSALHSSGDVPVGRGALESTLTLKGRSFFVGCDVSPALVGVGYIVGFEAALYLFLGGIAAWWIAVPVMGLPAGTASGHEIQAAWDVWSTKVRFIGAGVLLAGGLWSIVAVRRGLLAGIRALWEQRGAKHHEGILRTEWNITMPSILVGLAVSCGLMGYLYYHLTGSSGGAAALVAGVALLGVFAAAASSYAAGVAGGSNSPASGITIGCLVISAGVIYMVGTGEGAAVAASLGVAGVVCCAACASGDMSQNLKAGRILGATPRLQQVGQLLGVVIAAFILAPALSLFHIAYGIGKGLSAPQAAVFADMTRAVFGGSGFPAELVLDGAAIGAVLVSLNLLPAVKGRKLRFRVMPFAVGMYLPLTLTVPLFLGGIVSLLAKKRVKSDSPHFGGVLLSSGMIAGEAVIGMVTAFMIVMRVDFSISMEPSYEAAAAAAGMALVLLIVYLISARIRKVS